MIRITILLILIIIIFFIILNFKKIKKLISLKHLILSGFFLIIIMFIFLILPRFGINPIAAIQSLIGKILPILGMLRGF
mgnify:CR=1 FL=1